MYYELSYVLERDCELLHASFLNCTMENNENTKITVSSLMNLDIIMYIQSFTYVRSMHVMCCNLFFSREQRPELFLLFVEATLASMVS